MSIPNSRGRTARPVGASQPSPVPETGLEVAENSLSDEANEPQAREPRAYKADPWWSHAAWGLAMLALGLPYFIPGIPRQGLFVGYVIAATVGLAALMLWGAAHESLESWRAWRRRRTPGSL